MASAPNKSKKSRASAASTPSKPGRSSKSSRTSVMSDSRVTDSPVISLTSDDSSPVPGEPSLGKRKRRNTRHTPGDEDSKPVSKKQRIDLTSSSASRKARTKSIRSPQRIGRETIHEEEEDPAEAGDPDKASRSPPPPKVGKGDAVVRIGPPRRRKKIARLPSAATLPSSHIPSSAPTHLLRDEEEDTQEAAGIVPHPNSSPPTVKKKKRRLKPASDARPNLPTLAEEKPPVPPSRGATQEPQEPPGQEEPFEADVPPPDQDNEPTEPLPKPTPSRSARQQTPPGSPIDDDASTPTPPRAKGNAKRLGPVPRLGSSHFKPYLQAADTTSVIDEFSPKKPFPTQDTIEPSVQGSQVHRTTTKPRQPSLDPEPVDDTLDVDLTQQMQDVQDAYFDSNDQAAENEVPHQVQPTTVSDIG
jgi:hypothetical protein